MTDHKFTDEEVIKALECCANADCLNCPRGTEGGMCAVLLPSVLALVNRQKAEIEDLDSNLKAAYAAVEEKAKRLRGVLPIVAELKAEAIKEFAQELRKVLCLEYRGRFSLDDELAEYKVKNAIEWLVEKMTVGAGIGSSGT